MMGDTVFFNFGVFLAGIMNLSYLSPKVTVRDDTLENVKSSKVYRYCLATIYIIFKLLFFGRITKNC